MENIYLKLMQEFDKTGLSSKKSISKFMERNFKKPTSNDGTEWHIQNEDAYAFLMDVKHTGHFEFDRDQEYDIGYNHISDEWRWYDYVDIDARLTISGLEYLERQKTNDIVKRNSNLQTLAIMLTVLLTAITLIVSLRNSTSGKQVDTLQARIQGQEEHIHTLQIQLSQATNELFLEKRANKTSTKKP
jgi:hypothetical protein